MANKYLEKIAFLDVLAGGVAANKGDRIGGALVGGGAGGLIGSVVGHSLGSKFGPGVAALTRPAGSLAGGILGGKAYSAGKKALLGEKYRDREAEDRALKALVDNAKSNPR